MIDDLVRMKDTAPHEAKKLPSLCQKKGRNGYASPEKSPRKRKTKPKNGEIHANGKAALEKENATSSGKVDAFQFMMNSRHKSIGRNSPGKEIEFNNSLDSGLLRQDLKTRRSRLESWAEAKGASKRKRDYEEIGNCIEHKLEKRGKKLKEMLNIECESGSEVVTSRKKRAVIQSDTETSDDADDAGVLANNTSTSWKFKIKLNTDENSKIEEINLCNDDSNSEEKVDVNNTDDVKPEVSNERVLRSRHIKPKRYEEFVTSDSEDEFVKQKSKSKLKMAPVFLKAAPKPKLDPEVMEARRQFLMSGIPSSLKLDMSNKQISVENIDFEVFPSISHVLQLTDIVTSWEVPKIDLKLKKDEPLSIEVNNFDRSLLTLHDTTQKLTPAKKISSFKQVIHEIKSQNSHYPVYRIFKSIYQKSGLKVEKAPPKGRKRKQKKVTEVSPTETKTEDECKFMQWTDKYKAKKSDEIIGNAASVTYLKQWLTRWLNFKDKKKQNCDSESEFDVTDSDSRDSTKPSGNTVILKGPTGCGKTAAVYAVCTELGFEVLEVNASSKRTGRWLLQELQEATQSHQVRNKEFQTAEKRVKSKMCVLLVEDIDLVFEQDEGFSAALSQIVATSKRPLVMTTTDEPSSSVQKVVGDVRVIKFARLSPSLSVWLQIVCMVEGYYVDKASIEELLVFNKGDIRRTLLQLQLWVGSGCQLKRPDRVSKPHKSSRADSETAELDDDNSNLSDLRLDDPRTDSAGAEIQYNCLSLEEFESFSWPPCNDFETVYWNLSNILGVSKTETSRDPKTHKSKLIELSKFYDSLAFADAICNTNRFCESLERRWRPKPKNSLALEENMGGYTDDVGEDLAHFLLTKTVKLYREKFGIKGGRVDMAAASHKRWSKQLESQKRLEDVIPVGETLSRRATALDYLPTLRNIARLEAERAANNTKRGNRFYNYLKRLGVRACDANYTVAGDVFRVV